MPVARPLTFVVRSNPGSPPTHLELGLESRCHTRLASVAAQSSFCSASDKTGSCETSILRLLHTVARSTMAAPRGREPIKEIRGGCHACGGRVARSHRRRAVRIPDCAVCGTTHVHLQ